MSAFTRVVHDDSPLHHPLGTRVEKPAAPAPTKKRSPNPVEIGAAQAAEQEAHERRLAYIKAKGWKLTPEGWRLDTSDTRWHKQAHRLVPYVEGLSFEDGVEIAWRTQKILEAQELARRQRRGR